MEQTIAADQDAVAALTRKPRAEPPARNHVVLPTHLHREVQMLERRGQVGPLDTGEFGVAGQGSNAVSGELPVKSGLACWRLKLVYDLMLDTIAATAKVFTDDTTLRVFDPDCGPRPAGCDAMRSRTGFGGALGTR